MRSARRPGARSRGDLAAARGTKQTRPQRGCSLRAEGSMPATTTNLFLLQDLEDVGRTRELAESDLEALQAVADWIKTFVVKPHKDLGRAGTVCPFVPGSLERKVLWLTPEQITGRDEPDVAELLSGYKRLFLETQPNGGVISTSTATHLTLRRLPVIR